MVSEEGISFFCSTCKRNRLTKDFEYNKQGKRKLTCQRHSRKRALEINSWEEFIQAIRRWNKPGQREILHTSYTFNLDNLPVKFGDFRRRPKESSEGNPDSEKLLMATLNVLLGDLTEIIWKEGGFRFRHKGTNSQSLTFTYRCCQDRAHATRYQSTVDPQWRRDGRRMTRFDCQSKLVMRPCFHNRTLTIIIHHKWHAPYEEVHVPPMVRESINKLVVTKTPAKIYREIREIPGGDTVSRHQVYYLWRKANAEHSCYQTRTD
ncbi:hypothetical protein VTO42DRAFT_7374 [Malbranchea cinnamomea]